MAATLAVAALVGISGCSEEPACNLDASAIAMQVFVIDRDEEVEVDVVLEAIEDGASTPLVLCTQDDELTVNGEVMKLVRVLGQLYYVTTFESAQAEYSVEFTRKSATHVATVEPPPGFTIDAPALDSSHSRSADLAVSWSPAWDGQLAEVAVEDAIGSTCIDGLGVHDDVEDDGEHVFEAGRLTGMDAACEVDLVITRVSAGVVPSELHPRSDIFAIVSRRRPFLSSP